jgi:hypothetical protein
VGLIDTDPDRASAQGRSAVTLWTLVALWVLALAILVGATLLRFFLSVELPFDAAVGIHGVESSAPVAPMVPSGA